MMKKTLLVIFTCLAIAACDKEKNDAPPSKTQLLTNGTQKSWYLYSTSPEAICPSNSDDTWTFFANGNFKFDHGTVTESGDCGDLINFEGAWTFQNNETKIVITALRPTDQPDFDETLEIANATLTSLTADKIVLTSGTETTELRAK